MKVAIIDIGTNTFNLLIASEEDSKLKLDHVDKSFVFLGKGGINKNTIQPDAIERGIQCLKGFKKTASEFGCENILAIATSAVRNAGNGKDFVKQSLEQTGIKIQTISGNREAELIYKGAKQAVDFGSTPVLLMDVGGGSTEFIICDQTQIFWKQSFEVGAARLFEKFHKNDPITTEEITEIDNYLEDLLKPLINQCSRYQISTLIGSAGAFTSFAKIVANKKQEIEKLKKTSSYEFNLSEFYTVHQSLLKTHLNERVSMPGLIQERAPMIVVGTVLVNFILKELKISDFKLARYAMKEGMASEFLFNT
jgi:exopolyphosphatase/guanosine-5'-triphosphate,3'-diphosphate pyrophosphatase